MGSTLALAVLSAPHYALVAAPHIQHFILLYVGPDQMLPVMSALGAIIGVLLVVWNRVLTLLRKGLNMVFRRRTPIEPGAASDSTLADSADTHP
jgi:hypothetical protein